MKNIQKFQPVLSMALSKPTKKSKYAMRQKFLGQKNTSGRNGGVRRFMTSLNFWTYYNN